MTGTDYIKDKYPGDWTDFEIEAFAFNDGYKQAMKEIFEALGKAGEELLQSDDAFAEKIDEMKQKIKEDFESYT